MVNKPFKNIILSWDKYFIVYSQNLIASFRIS